MRELSRRMRRYQRVLVVGRVTREAVGRQAGVLTVHMALLALRGGVPTGERKLRAVVVDGRGFPCGHAVTDGAVAVELSGHVRRLHDGGVVALVAGPAVRGQIRVVAVHVAALAGLCGMRTHERELRGRVIEGGRTPPRHGVAGEAVRVEGSGLVRGIRGRRVLLHVAGDAGVRRAGEGAADMALLAGDLFMPADQRESRLCVIDGRGHPLDRLPCLCRVTVRTLHGKAHHRMIRPRRRVIRLGMTTVAGQRQPRVAAALVAACALDAAMRARQTEVRVVVIEAHRRPPGGIVTLHAGVRESPRRVIRLDHPAVVALVTCETVRRRRTELLVELLRMAALAGQLLMRAEKRKPRELMPRHFGTGIAPRRGLVAVLTPVAKLARMPVGMTLHAGGGQILERDLRMAASAGGRGMPPDQRVPCQRVIETDVLLERLPRCGRVAGAAGNSIRCVRRAAGRLLRGELHGPDQGQHEECACGADESRHNEHDVSETRYPHHTGEAAGAFPAGVRRSRYNRARP